MKSVLILEDENSVRSSLAAFAEDYEFKAFQAEDGETALELFEENDIDAAVVDVRLPGIDGTEFVKLAKEKNERTVFVFHTGSPEFYFPDELADLKQVSPKIFNKPVDDLSQIITEIERMIKTHKK